MTALFQFMLKSAKRVEISFQPGTGETIILHLSPFLGGFTSKTFAIKRCNYFAHLKDHFLIFFWCKIGINEKPVRLAPRLQPLPCNRARKLAHAQNKWLSHGMSEGEPRLLSSYQEKR